MKLSIIPQFGVCDKKDKVPPFFRLGLRHTWQGVGQQEAQGQWTLGWHMYLKLQKHNMTLISFKIKKKHNKILNLTRRSQWEKYGLPYRSLQQDVL